MLFSIFAYSLFSSAVSKVVHSGYLGMFVQARDSVEGSGCRGDGYQIPPSVHDQPGQSETVMLVLPILWHVTDGRDPIRGFFISLSLDWIPI